MEVRKYLIASIIILVVKVLFGILLHSNTLLASSVLELMFIKFNLVSNEKKDNKKYKGIFSSFISIVFILFSIGIVYYSIVGELVKPSWFIILIALIILIIRYMIVCMGIVGTYSKKKGLLSLGNMSSNMEFILFGIVIGSLIICKLSKFLDILKYGDILGTVIISLIVVYYGIRVIVNSIRYMEDKVSTKVIDENEITKQQEVKKINSITSYGFGGIRGTNIRLTMNNNVSMTDAAGFVLSLQDYALKHGEIVKIYLEDQNKVEVKNNKKPHVRSKKEDARNSRSRNSKANSKGKNTKKTNKKR